MIWISSTTDGMVSTTATTSTTSTTDGNLFGYPVFPVPDPAMRDAYERRLDHDIAELRARLVVRREGEAYERHQTRRREGYTSIDKRRNFAEEPDAWRVRSPRMFR